MNFYLLKTKYPDAKSIFLGDFNCYKPDVILSLSPKLRQLVHHNAHGDKPLDLIITDMHTLYHPPVLSHYLLPDDPDNAAPSDHLGNLLIPRAVPDVHSKRITKSITVRPFIELQISAIGRWITSQSWEHIKNFPDVDVQLESFSSSVSFMLDSVAPQKIKKYLWMTLHGSIRE